MERNNVQCTAETFSHLLNVSRVQNHEWNHTNLTTNEALSLFFLFGWLGEGGPLNFHYYCNTHTHTQSSILLEPLQYNQWLYTSDALQDTTAIRSAVTLPLSLLPCNQEDDVWRRTLIISTVQGIYMGWGMPQCEDITYVVNAIIFSITN
jgi:hypothetical protein